MNANSMIVVLITFSLISAISVNKPANAKQEYATGTVNSIKTTLFTKIAAPATSSLSGTKPQASPEQPPQHITKLRITSPTRDQQVPIGKDLTISGTSIDKANSNDCKVSIRVNKVRPYQPATAAGTGGAADYSKWNFVLTSKYATIKPGENRITAKYQCASDPTLTAFSSVNVTGITLSSQPSSPSALGLHTKQDRSAAPSNAATVQSNNGNHDTNKIVGSKGNPSESTTLTSKTDEMKNNILETLKQGIR
jgi:hypothetical protein